MTSRTSWTSEIRRAAAAAAIDADLLEAQVIVESGGHPWAMNPEPRYPYLVDVTTRRPFRPLTEAERGSNVPPADFRALAGDPDQEWQAQRMSWGLCIAAGTQVLTESGWRAIESIGVGTRVWDRNGQLSAVAATAMRRAACLSIKLGLNVPLVLTPNHPVFVRKSTIGKHNTGRRRIITAERPEWVSAGDLAPWDMVAMPRSTPTEDVEVLRTIDLLGRPATYKDATEYVEDGENLVMRYRGGGRERGRLNSEVKVDQNLLELCGLYLAEGNPLEKAKGAAFSFHRKETVLHARVIDLFQKVFGVQPRFRIDHKSDNDGVQVIVYGPAARWLTRLLPGDSRTQSIPGWVLRLPVQKQAALVRGMWLGDGCLGRGHYATASRSLAFGMAHVLLRFGIVARVSQAKSRLSDWYQVGLNSHDAVQNFSRLTGLDVQWEMTKNGRQRQTAVHWRTDADFIYFPVRSVREAGDHEVFDLQVPSDSSFVAERSVVHNCQIMGAVARERGIRVPYLSELCRVDLNLELGAAIVANLVTWAKGDVRLALAAYNGGLGGAAQPGPRAYAEKILAIRFA